MARNRYRTTTFALAALWLLTVGGLVYFLAFGATEAGGSDPRVVVNVTPEEKRFLLGEMRQLLEATQTIHVELGRGDREAAAVAAESVGMGMVEELAAVEATILFKLPAPMKELGLGTHRAFDDLAGTIRGGASEREVLGEMGQLMSRCVACHASYRLP